MTSPAAPSARLEDIAATRVALEQIFDKLQAEVDRCVDGFNHLVHQAGDLAWLLGPLPTYLVRNHLDDIRTHLKTLLDVTQTALQSATPVLSLFVTSLDYLNAAYSPVGQITYEIGVPADPNLNHWSGGAALTYRFKQATQKAAASKYVDNAAFMSDWLFDVGKNNVSYAVQLLKIVGDVAGELVEATANGLSVVNLPFALDDLAELVNKVIKAGLDQLLELANKFVETLGKVRDVLEEQGDKREFPNGHWPHAVHS